MLSPGFEQAPQPPSFFLYSVAAPSSSSSSSPSSSAATTTSIRYYRPFEHLLHSGTLFPSSSSSNSSSSSHHHHSITADSSLIGGLPSPPNSISSNDSSTLATSTSSQLQLFSSSTSESSITSPSAMSRARHSGGASGPAAAADTRLLHPLALHYAAQLNPLHVSHSRLHHHAINHHSGSAFSSCHPFDTSSQSTLPLLFASQGVLPPARLTTTGPKLSDEVTSDEDLDMAASGIHSNSNDMALNLTGRARSCSPTSTGSASGSRPSSAGLAASISPNTITSTGQLSTSFSLLTSSTILGQSPLLSTSIFPPPPTTPPLSTSPESSFPMDTKPAPSSAITIGFTNHNNSQIGSSTTQSSSPTSAFTFTTLGSCSPASAATSNSNSIGPALPSRSFSASLQRSHSAPYKPHKWLRPTMPTSECNSAATSPIPPLSSISPIGSLGPLSPLPTPPTPPQQLTSTPQIGLSNTNGGSSSLISSSSAFCSPLLHQHHQQLMTSLGSPAPPLPTPPPPPQLELRLTRQPAKFHRARYMTEGSRGPIRDKSGKSFPAIRLIGFDEHPVPVYCYLSDDRQIAQPHLFYQASKLSSRCVTSCTELRLGGTNALQFELQPSQNMELTIDCLGIVKQRLFEIQQNAAASGSSNSSASTVNGTAGLAASNGCAPLDRGAKSPCCRIVFECYLPKYNHILQTYSDTIHCKQVMRAPEVHRMSSNEAPSRGGNELFVIGKNFGKDARLLLRLDGSTWQAHAWPEKELLHQTHLVCRLPPIDNQVLRTHGECVNNQWRVQIELYVLCDGKRSAKQQFTYFES